MVVLILLIQIVMLVFYFKFLSYDKSSYFTGKEESSENWGWYFLVGLSIIFIIRFIYTQINFSYKWFDEIMELISFGICLSIMLPTLIYYLIKRRRQQKRK